MNTISNAQFEMISQLILTKLQTTRTIHNSPNNRKKRKTFDQKNGYTQGELVNWFIEHVVSLKLLRVKDAAEEALILPKVIQKLVKLGKIVAIKPVRIKEHQ